ncbi:hypothetical protein [Mucilaginibacter sp. CSA2-8R]|uniref:hypothetical protein n=1 Tax=Mucilaginibacter sp. CSA2-8R TaxID=3141542 RepID=UPI00315D9BED
MNWTLSVIIICVILALLFSWQEYRRTDRRRLLWRIMAIWTSLAALACIALPITYRATTPADAQTDAVLLTNGFNKDSIPAIAPVFTVDEEIKKAYPKAVLMSTLDELNTQRLPFKQIKILGYGIDEADLPQLDELSISYHTPPSPAGLQNINWPSKINTGEQLAVQGKFNNQDGKPVKLQLKGLGTLSDSVIILPAKTAYFQLKTKPKATGRLVYQIVALAGQDTLMNESIPVTIETTKPLRVLMLNAAPNFENRFLKNWLGENGYAVASKATISQGKISEDYINLNKLNLRHLSVSLLHQFDLVIGDLSALKTLPPNESVALKQQVTQKGLGLIVRADSTDKTTSWLQRDFPVNTVTTKEQPMVALTLQGSITATGKLSIDPSYISYRPNTQSLVTDVNQRELAAMTLSGAGKLVFTTLNHTNTWLLAGNHADYGNLWSLLISRAAKKQFSAQSWRLATALPVVDEPTQVIWQSGVAPQDVTINGTSIAPEQNPNIPYEWTLTYWPQNAGWQTVKINKNTAIDWFVHEKRSWESLRKLKRMTATQNFVANQHKTLTVTKQIQQYRQKEVSKIYFYLLLLIACTFLWVERKFAN